MAVSVSNCLTFQNTAKKYLSTTGQYHRFIPNVPQEFDCRVKANIKPESTQKNLTIKDEEFKTVYGEQYPHKVTLPDQLHNPPPCDSLLYLRNVEEKFIANPPRPIVVPLSEMKESFQMDCIKPHTEEVQSPSVTAKCYVIKQGCEQQPAVPPHRPGFWRWTDPYLTTYKSNYLPCDEVDDKIKEEVLTFYNEPKFDLPPVSGNKTLFDKVVFKNVLPLRLQTGAQKRVPHFGMQSEYQGHYIKQTFSNLYPYLHNTCTEFDDPLPPASRWQSLAAPAMYCSEYCNIGRKSVRSTIEQRPAKKQIVRTENCCRLY